MAVLVAPATAAVASPPAVDQYTQHLPDAGGGSGPASGDAPVARPELLSGKTQAALSRSGVSGRDGQLLAQIATARDLGAPESTDGPDVTSGDDQGLATVVADTALSAPGLALMVALGGIALVAGWTRSIRRGRSSSDLG